MKLPQQLSRQQVVKLLLQNLGTQRQQELDSEVLLNLANSPFLPILRPLDSLTTPTSPLPSNPSPTSTITRFNQPPTAVSLTEVLRRVKARCSSPPPPTLSISLLSSTSPNRLRRRLRNGQDRMMETRRRGGWISSLRNIEGWQLELGWCREEVTSEAWSRMEETRRWDLLRRRR